MLRKEAIEALAAARSDAISVATMQSSSPWHEAGQAEKDHLDAARCMGSASSLGLGLALANPGRKVMVLDGDGSLLMQLGSLVTVAHASPKNFYHFIFGNGVHESTGNQPLPGWGKFDFCSLALAAGYPDAVRIETKEQLKKELPRIFNIAGPVLISLAIDIEEWRPQFPGVPMSSQIQALRKTLVPPYK